MRNSKIEKSTIYTFFITIAIAFVSTFVSFAMYASNTQNSLSLVNYLYEPDGNHVLLKFILWMTVPIAIVCFIVFLILRLIDYIILCIAKQVKWQHTTAFVGVCMILVTLIFLFFVPVKHKIPQYRVQATVSVFSRTTNLETKDTWLSKTPVHVYKIDYLVASTDEAQWIIDSKDGTWGDDTVKLTDTERSTVYKEVNRPILNFALPTKLDYKIVNSQDPFAQSR